MPSLKIILGADYPVVPKLTPGSSYKEAKFIDYIPILSTTKANK